METKNGKGNYSVNIHGNATGVQIQQNTSNSSQFQSVDDRSRIEDITNVLDEINKFKPMFDDTYGEMAAEAKKTLENAIEAVNSPKSQSKVESILLILKDLTIRVSSSLVASGILGLLNQLGI